MKAISYEPAAFAAALAVLFQSAALFGWLPKAFQAEQVADAMVLVATALVGLYARSKGYPVAKIEDAQVMDARFNETNINHEARRGRAVKKGASGGPATSAGSRTPPR